MRNEVEDGLPFEEDESEERDEDEESERGELMEEGSVPTPLVEKMAEAEQKKKELDSKTAAMRPTHLLAYQFWRDHDRNVELTAKHVGVSRQALWKWRKRFDWDRMFELEEFADPLFADKVKRLSKEIQFAMLKGLHRVYCDGEPGPDFYSVSKARLHKDARAIVVGIEDRLLERKPSGEEDKSPKTIVAIKIE